MKKQILDPIRKKELVLTPEELVRQNVIQWLNKECNVPLALMAVEHPMSYNGVKYRADIVVFDRSANPLMLVECKAPSVKIDNEVIQQGLRYNRVLKVKIMMFTNGQYTYICTVNKETQKYEFITEPLTYEKMLEENE